MEDDLVSLGTPSSMPFCNVRAVFASVSKAHAFVAAHIGQCFAFAFPMSRQTTEGAIWNEFSSVITIVCCDWVAFVIT